MDFQIMLTYHYEGWIATAEANSDGDEIAPMRNGKVIAFETPSAAVAALGPLLDQRVMNDADR